LFFIFSRDQQSVVYQLIILTDCVLLLTTVAGTMLSMLQDRRRPVWPVMLAMLPFVLLTCAYMANPSNLLKQMVMIYLLLLSALFTVYMVFAIRRYDRWLNDNYADLEHKRVWLSQVVAFLCMLLFVLYVVAEDMVLIYCLHIVDLVLIFLLLWRVESLPQLDAAPAEEAHTPQAPDRLVSTASAESAFVPDTMPIMPTQPEQPLADPINIDVDQMEQLLKEHCEATRLYLENDLTLQMLAQAMGTNRSYLSQYFSRQGVTYNTYINELRINHFIGLYREAVSAGRPVSAKLLAGRSGYRSYSTFSLAFKQYTGFSVTNWIYKESLISSVGASAATP
jgi:AraC-like DNA-binding protein